MRKTDEKNEKIRDQISSILEAFGGRNDRKFKIIFSYSAKSTLKNGFWEAKFVLFRRKFLEFWKFSQKLSDKNAIEFKIWQI